MAALTAGSAVAQTAPAAAVASGPPPASNAQQFTISDGILATVNDSIITGFDLRQRMLLLIAMTQVQPTQENLPSIQREALNALIEERLQAQELRNYAENFTISDEDVAEEISARAQEAGTTAENYLGFLTSGGIRRETMIEMVRTQIGWGQLVGGRFQSRARPSPSAVDAALRQISESAQKKQYLIGEIYIEAARVGGQQAALNGANQLVTQMVQGAPFTAVAQQFSSAPSAVRGGDAGWVVEGTVQPALQQVFDQLQVGELSRPIPVDGGVYVVYMRDKREGGASNLVQMKQVMIEVPQDAPEAVVQAASQRLQALKPQITCDTMLARASSEQGLLGADLGESDVANLAPQFQQVAASGEVGTISDPVRTPLGLHLVAVCGRRAGGAEVASRQQVENQLFRQNLATLQRRYIRDLREDALIEFRQ